MMQEILHQKAFMHTILYLDMLMARFLFIEVQ
jgi:hypothetical protein